MKVEAKVAVGDARGVICHMADKLGAGIMVMGSHGYGFFKSNARGILLVIIEELGQLTELRVLNIFLLHEWNGKLVECLRKLEKVQDLVIWGMGVQRNIGGLDAWVAPGRLRSLDTQRCCWFSTLPAWMNSSHLPNLSKLSIAIREVHQADLDILGKLPALLYLSLLVDHEDLGMLAGFVIGAGCFACLKHCEFRGFVGPVVYQHGAMPNLRSLELWLSVGWAREIASSNGGDHDLGIGNLASGSLHKVTVYFDSDEATSNKEMKQMVAALRHATKIHPNHPQLLINGKPVEGTDAIDGLGNGFLNVQQKVIPA